MSQSGTIAAAGKKAGGYFSFARTPFAIAELDGLRAIAILLVLLRHAAHPLQQGHGAVLAFYGWDMATPFINGWIGVDLFFVLSGFLISCHLMRRNIAGGATAAPRHCGPGAGRAWSWRRYLSARALRIVPTYLFVMAIVVAGLIPLYHIAGGLMGVRIGYHILFLQDYLPANIVVSFWSLGVEEKFYLLAPLLILATLRLGRPRQRYALLAGIILLPSLLRVMTALAHPQIDSYEAFFPIFRSPFHLSFDGLIIGVLCAQIHMDRALVEKLRAGAIFQLAWLAGLAIILSHLLLTDLMGTIGWYDKSIQPLVISIGFGLILMSVICDNKDHRLLGSWGALMMARISYPLYLIHLPLIPLALAVQGPGAAAGFSGFASFAIVFISMSMLAALVIHFLVEKPFLLLKERMSAR